MVLFPRASFSASSNPVKTSPLLSLSLSAKSLPRVKVGDLAEKAMDFRLNWGLKGWNWVEGIEGLKERVGDKRVGIVVAMAVGFLRVRLETTDGIALCWNSKVNENFDRLQWKINLTHSPYLPFLVTFMETKLLVLINLFVEIVSLN